MSAHLPEVIQRAEAIRAHHATGTPARLLANELLRLARALLRKSQRPTHNGDKGIRP